MLYPFIHKNFVNINKISMKIRFIVIVFISIILFYSCENTVENKAIGTWEVVKIDYHRWVYKGFTLSQGDIYGWINFSEPYNPPRPIIKISQNSMIKNDQKRDISNLTNTGFNGEGGFVYTFMNSTDSTLVMKEVLTTDEYGSYSIYHLKK